MASSFTFAETFAAVMLAVTLATTDPAAISKLGVAWLAKKLGVRPGEIQQYENATDGDDETAPD